MIERIKYVTNKELLAEIHNSKNTYCSYEKPEYHRYDLIVDNLNDINEENIALAKAKHAARLSTKTDKIDPETIPLESLVFRLMSDKHIPVDETGKRKPKIVGEDATVKTNFPPFSHYVFRDGILVEVGRSHWIGSLSNGYFSTDHGRINNRLAMMLMLLVERYARRGNWRGYCVDDTTEALTQRGWLNMDQITTDDTILSYEEGDLKWSKIKSIYRDENYDGNMFHMTVRGMDAFVTPGHKFVTQDGLKEAEMLLEKDQIILGGNAVKTNEQVYSDAFVEMVGWAITEGNYHNDPDRTYTRVALWQNEGSYAQRIRQALFTLNETFGESSRRNPSGKDCVCFTLTKNLCEQITTVAPNKVLSMDFILSLTQSQREILINTMIDADGWRTTQKGKMHMRYCQKDKAHVDAFLALCTIAGYRTTFRRKDIVSYGKQTEIYIIHIFSKIKQSRVENIDFHGSKRKGAVGMGKLFHPNEANIPYKGRVWCPETDFGSFIARRNGTIYLTGNSYNDEMRSHALLQLSQIGLVFNEFKGDNPFSFYTTIITNCFRRILNLEKRNHHIRDDLLIMAGAAPSYTRQIEHDMESAEMSGEKSVTVEAAKKPRGRKPKTTIQD